MLVIVGAEVSGYHPIFERVTILGELRLVLRVLSETSFRFSKQAFLRRLNHDNGASVLRGLAHYVRILG